MDKSLLFLILSRGKLLPIKNNTAFDIEISIFYHVKEVYAYFLSLPPPHIPILISL